MGRSAEQHPPARSVLPEGMYLDGANTTQREAMGLPIWAFSPAGEPVDIVNHFVNFGWEYVYHCHILSHEEMDMMHAQVVGIAPCGANLRKCDSSGNGGNRQYTVTWIDNSKNETAFVIERSSSPTGPWSILATVPSDRLTDRSGHRHENIPGQDQEHVLLPGLRHQRGGGYLGLLQPGLEQYPAGRRMADADAQLEGRRRPQPSPCWLRAT